MVNVNMLTVHDVGRGKCVEIFGQICFRSP
jgi:hypothetical protein